MSKFQKGHVNQIWWERGNGMQQLGDMDFDLMITRQIKNVISQLSQRLQSPNLVGIHIKIKWYHSYMSRDLFYAIYYISICHSYMSRDHLIC